jgi:hypothetical protein
MRSFLFFLLTSATSACAAIGIGERPFVECNSTDTCRAQAAERDRAFAKAVAKEPPATRIDVELVSPRALVDRSRKLVYAIDRDLVALDLASGAQRWQVPLGLAPGAEAALTRAGRLLVVAGDPGKLPPKITFVDPDDPSHPRSCSLDVGAPKEAANVLVSTFDRAGQPYVFWRSWWSYHGGTPPGEAQERHEELADACGVVKIDPKTCTTSREPLSDFVWSPPEGRRERAGQPRFCGMLSPMRDIPAAAASAPPGAKTKDVRVDSVDERIDDCRHKVRSTLEAPSFRRVLDESEQEMCGPP